MQTPTGLNIDADWLKFGTKGANGTHGVPGGRVHHMVFLGGKSGTYLKPIDAIL